MLTIREKLEQNCYLHVFYWYIPYVDYYREQLRQYRLSLHHQLNTTSTTQDKLAEQKEWLKRFGQDLNLGSSFIHPPQSEHGSVYPSDS